MISQTSKNFPFLVSKPASELEAARRHLQKCQTLLAIERRHVVGFKGSGLSIDAILSEAKYEDAVSAFYAALSWVWDAQERAAGPTEFVVPPMPFINPGLLEPWQRVVIKLMDARHVAPRPR